jgi:cell division protein FtsI/penicillin-binding protein 2
MLTSTFDHALVGGKYRMPNYQVAAKTGTAQIAAGGNYEKDRYLHSFFGYFPASKPRFIVFFFMVNPRGVKFAADSLSGPFADLSRFLINYYEIAPDR